MLLRAAVFHLIWWSVVHNALDDDAFAPPLANLYCPVPKDHDTLLAATTMLRTQECLNSNDHLTRRHPWKIEAQDSRWFAGRKMRAVNEVSIAGKDDRSPPNRNLLQVSSIGCELKLELSCGTHLTAAHPTDRVADRRLDVHVAKDREQCCGTPRSCWAIWSTSSRLLLLFTAFCHPRVSAAQTTGEEDRFTDLLVRHHPLVLSHDPVNVVSVRDEPQYLAHSHTGRAEGWLSTTRQAIEADLSQSCTCLSPECSLSDNRGLRSRTLRAMATRRVLHLHIADCSATGLKRCLSGPLSFSCPERTNRRGVHRLAR